MAKPTVPTVPEPFDPREIARELHALVARLGLTDLTRAERERLRSRSHAVPDELIEQLAAVAAANDGKVGGLTFDPLAARDALEHARAAHELALVARRLASRFENESMLRRAAVADRAFAIYQALARLVNTPEGASLRRAFEEMRTAVRARRRLRRGTGRAEREGDGGPTGEPDGSSSG